MTGAAIPLDMFTTLIAVHWPDNEITKLDFVGDRYMVRGKDQDLDEVLGDELSSPGHRADGATQRSWRTVEGLDLRSYNEFGLTIAQNKAFLKNKIPVPTKKNPGALNEFLYLSSTLVIEFDWIDVVATMNAQTGGGFPDGIDVLYEMFMSADRTNDRYFNMTNCVKQGTGTGTFLGSHAWEFPATGNSMVNEGGITLYEWGPPVSTGLDESEWPYPPPGPLACNIGETTFAVIQPAPEPYTFRGSPHEGPYTIIPELSVHEWDGDAPPIDGRIVGGMPDPNGSYNPMSPGGGPLPAPYGRHRIAMTMDDDHIAVCLDGGPIIKLGGVPLFDMPREPPVDTSGVAHYKYFPITEISTTHKSYEAYFSFPGIVRCVWLYRKKKKDKELRKFSTVRTLTPPDSPKWKTT